MFMKMQITVMQKFCLDNSVSEEAAIQIEKS